MTVKFHIICFDKDGRQAMLSGEGNWLALDMKDADHLDGFEIKGMYEIATSSEFLDQTMLILDDKFANLADHSHQRVTRRK